MQNVPGYHIHPIHFYGGIVQGDKRSHHSLKFDKSVLGTMQIKQTRRGRTYAFALIFSGGNAHLVERLRSFTRRSHWCCIGRYRSWFRGLCSSHRRTGIWSRGCHVCRFHIGWDLHSVWSWPCVGIRHATVATLTWAGARTRTWWSRAILRWLSLLAHRSLLRPRRSPRWIIGPRDRWSILLLRGSSPFWFYGSGIADVELGSWR